MGSRGKASGHLIEKGGLFFGWGLTVKGYAHTGVREGRRKQRRKPGCRAIFGKRGRDRLECKDWGGKG